jgi:sialic acid synthase SpsE
MRVDNSDESGKTTLLARPVMVAEIGGNHAGNPELAAEMVKAAQKCGFDAVKFQAYRTEEFLHPECYGYADFKKEELGFDDLAKLADLAKSIGLKFILTVFDREGIELAEKVKADSLKICSGDLVNLNLLKLADMSGLPIILSTGASHYADVFWCLGEIRNSPLTILQCTSLYPAKNHEMNISFLAELLAFGFSAGLSDHSVTARPMEMAWLLGAKMVEKHFTIDRNLPGGDNSMSILPSEFEEMTKRTEHWLKSLPDDDHKTIDNLRNALTLDVAWGDVEKDVLHGEEQNLLRRVAVARRNVNSGDRLGEDDVKYLRLPKHAFFGDGDYLGPDVDLNQNVVAAKTHVRAGQPIFLEDLSFELEALVNRSFLRNLKRVFPAKIGFRPRLSFNPTTIDNVLYLVEKKHYAFSNSQEKEATIFPKRGVISLEIDHSLLARTKLKSWDDPTPHFRRTASRASTRNITVGGLLFDLLFQQPADIGAFCRDYFKRHYSKFFLKNLSDEAKYKAEIRLTIAKLAEAESYPKPKLTLVPSPEKKRYIMTLAVSRKFAKPSPVAEKLLNIAEFLEIKEFPIPAWLPKNAPMVFHSNMGILESDFEEKFELLLPDLRNEKFELFSCDLGPAARRRNGYSPDSEILSEEEILTESLKAVKTIRSNFSGRIALENYNYYPTGLYEHVCQPEFITKAVKLLDVGLVLDLAHAAISAYNMGLSMNSYLAKLPLDRVVEIHLSKPYIPSNSPQTSSQGLLKFPPENGNVVVFDLDNPATPKDLHECPDTRELNWLEFVLLRLPSGTKPPLLVVVHYGNMNKLLHISIKLDKGAAK